MEAVHQRFEAGGKQHSRLDDSSPFRRRGQERTARGRSWAIHDGVLDGPWEGVKMFRAPDAPAGISTFPGGTLLSAGGAPAPRPLAVVHYAEISLKRGQSAALHPPAEAATSSGPPPTSA